jgi:uncharacterized protein (TIGR00375 family)
MPSAVSLDYRTGFIADLHIHSKFSRATSLDMVIPRIAEYSKLKGITLMATGDFTHPEWLAMLKADLKPNGKGLFSYNETYFTLSTEVNNIYTRKGELRRVHNLIFAPSFEDVEKINGFLGRYGNLKADGRPILSLDSKDMLETILEISPDSYLVPSHIWTPWFSLFGANSGFDSIKDCFDTLADRVFALETGLSSDPAMNWRLSALDRYTLISNSDAHSPSRIGREANVFKSALDYFEIKDILRTRDNTRFLYTIEFFPEEGKYHFDGHRKCNIRLAPKESILNNDLCPVCGRRLTVGVLHRVESLADRDEGFVPPNNIPFKNLVPLEEIIAEALGVGRDTVGVKNKYLSLVKNLGGEFNVLLSVPIAEIERHSDRRIALGVEKVRKGDITVLPGYDGVFGTIHIFGEEPAVEQKKKEEQMGLF